MRETKTNTGSTTCATQTLSETETFRSSAVRYQHVALLPDFLGSLQLLDRKQHGRARLDEAYRKAAPSLLANRNYETNLTLEQKISEMYKIFTVLLSQSLKFAFSVLAAFSIHVGKYTF
ncbi:hypothetical protein OUZ56_029210 [Daphnia magna]|uniref:Uncharacterized protein n=1 Tax=Daphnia magna TaxID=35525 RepID=A0ABR0B653_9CRUS|nr:hypothetical protein OUZ56_029210 [Daphnia magna]